MTRHNKNAHTYQYSATEVSQQGNWNHSQSAIMWCYVWCVVCYECSEDYWGHFVVWGCISYWYVTCSDVFWTQDDDNGRTYAFFEQDSATFDYSCIHPLHYVFGDSNKQRIMASSFIYLNPCNFYLWCMLKEKLYRNSLYTKGGLKESIQDVVFSALPAELLTCNTMSNIFVECDTSVWIEGNHFEHHL